MSKLALRVCVVGVLASGSAFAQPVMLTADTSIGAADRSLDGLDIIVEGATLTIDGMHEFRSLIVRRNGANRAGVVTHSPAFVNGDGPGLHLHVTGDLTLQGATGSLVASRIDATGRGFPSAQGPGLAPFSGTGVCCGRGGSGHGGAGGMGSTFPGGPAYGSAESPPEFGTGGTPRFAGANAGSGGGAIWLTVDGAAQVDGLIAADGGTCQGDNGAPSGGSIRLAVGTLVGSGEIRARGGTNLSGTAGGGGGGGRIGIEACSIQMVIAAAAVAGGSGFRNGEPGSVEVSGRAPGLLHGPIAQSGDEGSMVTFSCEAVGTGSLLYQWNHAGSLLQDGDRVDGASGPVLVIRRVERSDVGPYTVTVTDDCGVITSPPADLDVFCRADWNQDHMISPADLGLFIQAFSQGMSDGSLAADFNGDGVISNTDAAAFMAAWYDELASGC